MPLVYKIDVLAALKEKGYNTTVLRKEKLLAEGVIQSLREGKPISWKNIETICTLLRCQPGDIMEYIPDEESGRRNPMPLHETKKATLADWEALGEDVRAELIDGEIYNMAGPTTDHQAISSFLHSKIYSHLEGKPCRVFYAPFDVHLQHEDEDTPNIVQPDLMVICDRNKITKKGCVGAPDWIIEIVSPSTARRDYLTKLNLYVEYGVKEYWIVNPDREAVTVYQLDNDLLPAAYTFRDTITVHTLGNLRIDFTQLDLE